MKKLLTWLLGGTALLVVLLLIAPMFISAEAYKSLIAQQVKKATGRTLNIAGDASLKLFPTLAIDVKDVTLSNLDGFKDKNLAEIKSLSVKVALKPLLNKRIEMKGVAIDGAVIALEERKDGSKSWEFKTKQAAADATETSTESKADSGKSAEIMLGNIAITNSTLTFRKPGAETLTLEKINLDVSSTGLDSELTAAFSGVFKGSEVALDATLGSLKAFMEGSPTSTELSLTLPDSTIRFTGQAAQAKTLLAKGALNVALSDVSALTKWATGKAAGGAKSVKLDGTLSASDNRFAITGGSYSIDAVSATGDISVALADKPTINGDLKFGTLDLDAFGADASTSANAETSPASAAAESSPQGWSTEPIDFSGLKAANAALNIAADAIKSGKLKLGATRLKVLLNDGVLNVNDIATNLYDGTAEGGLKASADGAVAASLVIKGVQIEPLMTALSGKSRLAGTTNLSLSVTGSGKSQHAIISSLGGSANLRVEDGAILGVNLGKFLRDAKQGFLFSSGTSERTDFAELTASFAIASGIVSNSDLYMKAPLLRLGGKGTISMPPKTIDYTLMPKIAATSQGQGGKDDKAGIAIPLRITGGWANPSITPDVGAALEENLKNPEAIKENIKGISDSVKQLNSKDDLKKALSDGLNKNLGGSEGESPKLENLLKGF